MKGIYLCSRKHRLPGYYLDYNDIENYPGINLCCDCRNVDLIIKLFLETIHLN